MSPPASSRVVLLLFHNMPQHPMVKLLLKSVTFALHSLNPNHELKSLVNASQTSLFKPLPARDDRLAASRSRTTVLPTVRTRRDVPTGWRSSSTYFDNFRLRSDTYRIIRIHPSPTWPPLARQRHGKNFFEAQPLLYFPSRRTFRVIGDTEPPGAEG